MFKECGRYTTPDVRRTTEAYLSYKLTNEPKGSGELKMGGVIEDHNLKNILLLVTFPTVNLFGDHYSSN